MQKRPQSQGGQARESQSQAQSPGLHFSPCPRSTPLPHQSCQGDAGLCLAFRTHLASGISQTPRVHHFLSVGLPGASVSWTRPHQLSASCLGELGPDPGPLPQSHPSSLLRASKPGNPAAAVAGSEDGGEVAGQTWEAQDLQNNWENLKPSTAGEMLSWESGHPGSAPGQLLCFLIYLLKDSVLMSFEVFSVLIFFEISACVKGQFISPFCSFCPSPWQFASRWGLENNLI